MKKIGMLHGELSKILGEMAHHDLILIGDAGMPCPEGVPFIDLAVTQGVPRFLDVLKVVMEELYVEEAYIDVEGAEKSPEFQQKMIGLIGTEFPYTAIPHADLQEMAKGAKAMIRTGEFTPYANIILKSGVLF